MNKFERERQQIQRIKEMYPKGTRIELICMEDPFSPVPPGTRGSVRVVDNMGTLHMNWDNGRTLGVVPGEDSFRKLTQEEIEAEKIEKSMSDNQNDDVNMEMKM